MLSSESVRVTSNERSLRNRSRFHRLSPQSRGYMQNEQRQDDSINCPISIARPVLAPARSGADQQNLRSTVHTQPPPPTSWTPVTRPISALGTHARASLGVSLARTILESASARSEEEGLEESGRLLHDRCAVDELLHGVAGDGEHGHPAVLDLGERIVRTLVAQVERVEAKVARHVV